MADKNKSNILVYLFLTYVGILIIPFISSCGKGNNALPVGVNTQLQIINLSPDLQPINLWVGFIRRNVPYSYPIPSGYFSLANIDTPLQIRSASSLISSANLISLDTILRANVKYTLFVTGLRADSSITGIFTVDTASAPTVGRGKIRFINASPRSGGLDVIANGTPAFTNQKYLAVTKFIEIPPGNYNFKITQTGSTTTELKTLPNITVQDGKLYTLYCHGLVGRQADSTAFNAGVLANK